MTLYLQRLFDRAQALQAEVTAVNRVTAPSAELDQRLMGGTPDLEQLAGLGEGVEAGEYGDEKGVSGASRGRTKGAERASEGSVSSPFMPGFAPVADSPFRPQVVAADPARPAEVITRLERDEAPVGEGSEKVQLPPVTEIRHTETRIEPGTHENIQDIGRELRTVETRHETVVREVAPEARVTPAPVMPRPEPVETRVESRTIEARPVTVTPPPLREVERVVEADRPAEVIHRVEPAPLREAMPAEDAPEIVPPRQSPPPKRETARNEVKAEVPAQVPLSLSSRADSPPILTAEQASMIGPLERLRPVMVLRGLRRR